LVRIKFIKAIRSLGYKLGEEIILRADIAKEYIEMGIAKKIKKDE
jgi:hypothetical protein|tara:strand:+ start:264 stop:398 length:135 start_codon:yes stop_codon:yes gene_type:complete